MKHVSGKISSYFIPAFLIVIILILGLSCSKSISNQEIMAKVGDRIITIEEFKSRIELTSRPEYEDADEAATKNALLKNLIAEKCAALEAEDENPIQKNENLLDQMQGIREQAMRDVLYKREAWDKVQIRKEAISTIYPLAGRIYTLAMHTFRDPEKANILKRDMYTIDPKDRAKYLELFIGDKKMITREIPFQDLENPIVHDALFSRPLDIGEIVGPVQVEEKRFLVMKVLDRKDKPVIGPDGVRIRRRETEDVLHRKAAGKVWAEYKLKMMRDKQLFFEKDPFMEIADYILHELNPSKTARNDERVFSKDFLQTAFFSIGDRVWTVGDFQEMLRTHPLVYRKKQFDNRDDFLIQFKYAVADLIADVYLTQKAYDAGLDKSDVVMNKETMWRDAMISAYHMNQTVRSFPDREDFDPARMTGRGSYLEGYVDDLLNQYRNRISVNLNALDEISLPRPDRYAIQKNVPFPIPVPAFPNYTGNSDLIYHHTIQNK